MNQHETLSTLIDLALSEDLGDGDWTTRWTVEAGAEGRAVVVAKEALVVAGLDVAGMVFHRVSGDLQLREEANEGDLVERGAEILALEGPLRGILMGERVALNFLGRMCGIASLTHRYVEAVGGTGVRILDTRKTTPGLRALEKAAVRAGGGENHRMGLYDMVLIKDNHMAASGGVVPTVERVRAENHRNLPVEVEVASLQELEELLPLGVDRVLLDNMSPETLARAMRRIRQFEGDRPEAEASGNVTLDNVLAIAETGVDFISVGALTHSAAASDLSLRVLGS